MGDRIRRASFLPAAFPFVVMGGTLDCDFRSHSHEFAELVIVLGGDGLHTIDSVPAPVGAGDVFLLQGPTEHGFIRPRRLWHYNLMYDPAVLLAGAGELRAMPGYQALFLLEPRYRRGHHRFRSHFRLTPPDLKLVGGMLRELEAETTARPAGWTHMVRALFLRLVIFLARAYEAASADTGPENAGLYKLAETLAFMETHFREALTVDALARRAALSRRHFVRLFRQYAGTSPMDYLIRQRLECAARCLARDGSRVAAAATAAGFTDSNYFARQFRRVYGCAPRAWRAGTS